MTLTTGPALTEEEQAQLSGIQDRLIELFANRGAAFATGDRARIRSLQDDIDELLRQRDALKQSARADGK